jgi:myo-inositol-1(or 4)-monophosphatase
MRRSRIDLGRARAVAVEIAEEAGALLRARSSGQLGTRVKGTHGDVVTNLDLAAEALILDRLHTHFPDHRVVAEESGAHGLDNGWTWLVDPLDGTNNVAIGLSTYVVGLALCLDRRPVLGVIHDPVAAQTWSAIRGAGTTGPAGRLLPPMRDTPHGPVLGWTQGHGVPRTDATACALKLVLEQHARRMLQLWAPLLCWVLLARGDIDGFVGYRAEAIDLPAGSLVAAEAGLSVVTFDGEPFDESVSDPVQRSFIAGHPDRIAGLLKLVRAAEGVRPGLNGLLAGTPVVVG